MTDSFWADDDGVVVEQEKEFEIGSGGFEPLPAGLLALAVIKTAKWEATTRGDNFIQIEWQIAEPEKYKNRIVFQKLWVMDFDPNTYDEANVNRSNDEDLEKAKRKRIKAKTTLATIDANATGKLFKKQVAPTTQDLTRELVNRAMNITIQQYKFRDQQTGEWVVGNWVGAVGPRDDKAVAEHKLPTQPRKPEGGFTRVMDDSIPF